MKKKLTQKLGIYQIGDRFFALKVFRHTDADGLTGPIVSSFRYKRGDLYEIPDSRPLSLCGCGFHYVRGARGIAEWFTDRTKADRRRGLDRHQQLWIVEVFDPHARRAREGIILRWNLITSDYDKTKGATRKIKLVRRVPVPDDLNKRHPNHRMTISYAAYNRARRAAARVAEKSAEKLLRKMR